MVPLADDVRTRRMEDSYLGYVRWNFARHPWRVIRSGQ